MLSASHALARDAVYVLRPCCCVDVQHVGAAVFGEFGGVEVHLHGAVSASLDVLDALFRAPQPFVVGGAEVLPVGHDGEDGGVVLPAVPNDGGRHG